MRVSNPRFAGRLEGFNAEGQMIVGGRHMSAKIVEQAARLIEAELPDDVIVRVVPDNDDFGAIPLNMRLVAEVISGNNSTQASALYTSSQHPETNERRAEEGFLSLMNDAITVGRKLDQQA